MNFQKRPHGVCLFVRVVLVIHVAHMGGVKLLKYVYAEISRKGADGSLRFRWEDNSKTFRKNIYFY
jgi:hypothetical protein